MTNEIIPEDFMPPIERELLAEPLPPPGEINSVPRTVLELALGGLSTGAKMVSDAIEWMVVKRYGQ